MNVTVVVGVDNSEASKEALRLAAQGPLAAGTSHRGERVRAADRPGRRLPGFGDAYRREQRATAEAELRATVDEELGDQAAQTELRVSAGLAGCMIVETARQTHAQLVVLAARTGMAVMPGTVSQYVLLKSHCPVTIVPHNGKDEETDDNHP